MTRAVKRVAIPFSKGIETRNALCRAYIRANFMTGVDAGEDTQKWVEEKLREQQKKVEAAESAVQKFAREHHLLPYMNHDEKGPSPLQTLGERLALAEQKVFERESDAAGV